MIPKTSSSQASSLTLNPKQFRTAWTVDPTTGVYSSSIRTPTGIAADPPLTSHGSLQADELGRHLTTLEPPIDAVYSSPYYRCLQTISPFVKLRQRQQKEKDTSSSQDLATSIRPDHGIAEWFGAAPFQHPRPASSEVLKSMFPAYSLDYASTKAASDKGETLPQLYERVASAMRAIVERCDEEGHRAIVLCTHAAVVIALGRVLTGDMPETPDVDDFQAYTCGLSTYRRVASIAEEGGVEQRPAPGKHSFFPSQDIRERPESRQIWKRNEG